MPVGLVEVTLWRWIWVAAGRAVFRVLPPRSRREMWVASLLWTQFCLENGGLHRGPPFAIKRTTLIGWKGFSKWQPPYGGCHLQSKEQFWLVELAAILEEPFASFLFTLKLETPPRLLQDKTNGRFQWEHTYCLLDLALSGNCGQFPKAGLINYSFSSILLIDQYRPTLKSVPLSLVPYYRRCN